MGAEMNNRIEYDHTGRLDEVVTDGGAHLEYLGRGEWFLSCQRADGSSFCVWFTGKITMSEEREPPKCGDCGQGIPAKAPGDGFWLACLKCGWSARPKPQE